MLNNVRLASNKPCYFEIFLILQLFLPLTQGNQMLNEMEFSKKKVPNPNVHYTSGEREKERERERERMKDIQRERE